MKVNYFLKRLLVFSFALLVGSYSYAQLTCTQSFSASGQDDDPTTLTITPTDITCTGGGAIDSVKITNVGGSISDSYCGNWYDFNLAVNGTAVVTNGCGTDFDGQVITGPFTSIVATSNDLDVYSDGVTISFNLTVYYAPPACAPPTAIMASSVTTTSASIGWTTGGASNWNVEYGQEGFTQGTGTMMYNASNPTALSTLTPGTYYDVYVQDSCGIGDVSTWVKHTFATLAPTETVPFSDDFEGTLGSWALAGSYRPMLSQSQAFDGSNSAELVNTKGTTGEMVVTLNAATNPRISFSYYVDYYWSNEFTVYIMESDSSTWKELHDFGTMYGGSADDDIWLSVSDLDLASYNTESNTFKLKFEAENTSSYSAYSVFLDAFSIYIPAQNDLAMISWNYPNASIESSSDSVKVSLWNKGTQSQTGFGIAYSLDNGVTYTTDTYSGTLNGGDTLHYTFAQTATMPSGSFTTYAVVTNPGDTFNMNDTVMGSYINHAVPFTFGFENDPAGSLPAGWSMINTLSSSYASVDISSGSSSAYDGTKSIELYNSSSTSGDLIAIFPEFQGTTLSDKWLNFFYKAASPSELIVGIMTDPADETTFVGLDTLPSTSSFQQAFVLLSPYTGTGKYIAFKHSLDGTYGSHYIDEITLELAPTGPIYTVNMDTVHMNDVRYNYPDTSMHTVTIMNTGVGLLNVATPSLAGANAANFMLIDTNTYPKNLALNESITFDVKFFGSAIGTKTADISLVVNTVTEVINLNGEIFDATINSFPYVEDFDDQSLDIGWSLRSNDGDFIWKYDDNTTSSSDTGPDGDVTGGYYIYSEASSPADPGDVASIYTNPIDFTGLANPELRFWYHMYGAEIDTFAIEAATGGTWTLLDTIIGEQMSDETDPWMLRSIDLSAYTTIDSVRFYVIRGSGYYGDVALDNIAFGADFAVDLGPDTASCGPLTLSAPTGAYMYEWIDLADTTVAGTMQDMTFDTTGTYVLRVMDAGYFGGTDTINITINDLPTVSFTGLEAEYCLSGAMDTLVGLPAGGTFSGNGITGDMFNPSPAGAGNAVITYTYTDVNGCVNYAMDTTYVLPAATLAITGLNTDYCVDAAAVTLTASPIGGTLSGNGITGFSFDPMTAGTGTQAITYTFTDTNNCVNTLTVNTTVNALPVLNTTPDMDICLGETATIGVDANPVLFFSQYMEGSGNNKAIEIYNGSNTTVYLDNYAFPNVSNTPNTVGEYEYWNTFTPGDSILPGDVYVIAHGSADSATIGIHADMNFTFLSNGDDGFALVKNDGVWNDANNDGDVDEGEMTGYTVIDWLGDFNGDPGAGWDVAGVANATKDHTLIRRAHIVGGNTSWTASAGADSASSEWDVLPQNDATGLGSHTMTGTVPMSTYLWNSAQTTNYINVTPTTTTTYYVTVTDPNACVNNDSVKVMVNALPVVNLGNDTSICAEASITLDAGLFAAYDWSTTETTQAITVDSMNTGVGAVNISVMVTDTNACMASDTIEVTFMAPPVVAITAPDSSKYTHDLTVSATSGFTSYTWTPSGSTADVTFPGSTLTSGAYETFTVTVIDGNGCAGTATADVYIINDVSIENVEGQLDVSVYPNPSKGQFNLTVDGYNGELVMNIFSANGQLVHSASVQSNQGIVHKIDIQDLSKGVYFLNIQGNDASKTLRLIVQ